MSQQELSAQQLARQLIPQLSLQLRGALTNIHTALAQIAPEQTETPDPAMEKSLAILYQSYYRLLRLTNQLGAVPGLLNPPELTLRNIDLSALVEDLYQRCRPLCQEAGKELSCQRQTDHCIISADAALLQRLLLNLLSNALSAAPSGSTVLLSLRVLSRYVLLSVADNGPGIPPSRQEDLFALGDPQQGLSLTPQGIGLGLPLCRMIAEAHGGSISVQSDASGTTVTVSLPRDRLDNTDMRDVSFDFSDFSGGFNPLLMELSDALPYQVFTARHLD